MRVYALVTMLFAVGATVQGCATSKVASPSVSDEEITERVQNELALAPKVRQYQIDVDTLDGVVTLQGFVVSDEARQIAEEVASGVAGVRRVKNDIELQKLGADARPQLDAWITAEIGRKLTGHPLTRPADIEIDTQGQVVTLSGVAPSEDAVEAAELLAAEVEFVEKVYNRIEIVRRVGER